MNKEPLRMQMLAGIITENEYKAKQNKDLNSTLSENASEVLAMLAHPTLKKNMEQLADILDDAEYMAIKKLYDKLYSEVKKYELSKVQNEESKINEKINFMLGSSIDGDPDKPMKDDFYIVFNDTKKAIITIGKVNEDLKARGLKPIEYNIKGFVFKKPSNQQFQFVLNAFEDQDVMNVGRVLK